MTIEEITDKIREILIEQLGIDEAQFDEDKTWEDLGADSLDSVELVMAIEAEFGVDIESADAEELEKKSIGGGIAWLKAEFFDQP